MTTLFIIIASLVLLHQVYRSGRSRGHREAVSHCSQNFILMLRTTKQAMDNWLIKSAFSQPEPETFKLEVTDQVFVEGNATQVAEWSMEIGELLGRLENLFPAHVHKQV